MTVAELIAALEKSPQDNIVWVRYMDELVKAEHVHAGEIVSTIYTSRGE